MQFNLGRNTGMLVAVVIVALLGSLAVGIHFANDWVERDTMVRAAQLEVAELTRDKLLLEIAALKPPEGATAAMLTPVQWEVAQLTREKLRLEICASEDRAEWVNCPE